MYMSTGATCSARDSRKQLGSGADEVGDESLIWLRLLTHTCHRVREGICR
jgi:hypothetical protein